MDPDLIAPSIPARFAAAVPAPTKIDLWWDPSTDTGGSEVESYTVSRNGIAFALIPHLITQSRYYLRDTGLVPGTLYSYTVQAQDRSGIYLQPHRFRLEH